MRFPFLKMPKLLNGTTKFIFYKTWPMLQAIIDLV